MFVQYRFPSFSTLQATATFSTYYTNANNLAGYYHRAFFAIATPLLIIWVTAHTSRCYTTRSLAGEEGLEPSAYDTKNRCSTIELLSNIYGAVDGARTRDPRRDRPIL